MKYISACTLDCPDCCSCEVRTENDRPAKLTGNPAHPFTRGFLCAKSSKFLSRLTSEKRITTPLLKDGESFSPISWEQALNLCAGEINALRERPESILHLRGYGYRGVLGSASSNFFKALGASGTYGALCDSAGEEACLRDFGSLKHNRIQNLGSARSIVNWGRDIPRTSIHTAAIVARARKDGTKVMTISPGGDGAEKFSDEAILIRPGTDRFLAAGVLKLFIERKGIAPGVGRTSANLAEFLELLDSWDISALSAACGVSIRDMARIREFYENGPIASIIGWGVQRQLHGGQNVRFINALAFATGNVGISGGGSYYAAGSSSRHFHKWQAGTDRPPGKRREFLLPDIAAEVKEATPPVEMIWVDGINVANQVPDCNAAARMLEDCPFTVVMDAFMNDTALRADLVLPCKLMFEREDAVGSCLHGFVNYCAPVCDAPGECRDDFDVLSELGARLDSPVRFPSREECLSTALAKCGADLTELREKGFFEADTTEIAYKGHVFDHPDGKFHFVKELSPEPEEDARYPLHLLTLVSKRAIHTQLPEEDQQELPEVFLAADSPHLHNLSPESEAWLVSPLGRLKVRLSQNERQHPDTVIVRRGGWNRFGQVANTIIQPMISDMGDCAAFYSQKVRLEPAE